MKKAQLEGMEQVMIIFIIVIIAAVLVGVFAKIMLGGSKIEQLQRLERSAVEIATVVSAMPELQCTKNNVVTANCINMLKATVIQDKKFLTSNKAFYHGMFGFSKISIVAIYPATTTPTDIYDRSSEIPLDKRRRTFSITLPRLIYDPTAQGNCFALGKGSCNYGQIKIEIFVK